MLALVSSLALLTLISHFAMRRHVALIWLAMALIVGACAVPLYVSGGSGATTMAWLASMDTIAVFAVCQASRVVIGQRRCSWKLVAIGAALLALSLILITAGIGNVVRQTAPFQMAGLLFIADALIALFRHRRHPVDYALLAGMGMYLASSLVRLPFYPALLDEGQAYPELGAQWINGFMLATSSIFVPLIVISIIARDLVGHIDQFRETSKRDGLTGLLTRLAFEHAAGEAHPRYGALIVCDLDHFKIINDTFGHPAGDEALRAFALLCRDASPIAGRIGGEEFAILVPGATLIQAEALAAQIRTDYASCRPSGIGDMRLTASFGIAAYGGGEGFRDTLIKADRALYRAKRQGRDCVVLHGTIAGESANRILRTA